MARHRLYKRSHHVRDIGQWVFGSFSYRDFEGWQQKVTYLTHGVVWKAFKTKHTRLSQLFWPQWMTPSFSLLFHIAWSLLQWWAVPGAHEPDHSSRARAYTNCPKLYCRAAKFIICRHLLCNNVDLAWSNVHISVTIGVAIIATAFILSPSTSGDLHPILGSVYFALATTMACRVFRAVLLGTIKDTQVNTAKLVSFYHSTANTRNNNDVKPGSPSKLEINVAVEMPMPVESNGWRKWSSQG